MEPPSESLLGILPASIVNAASLRAVDVVDAAGRVFKISPRSSAVVCLGFVAVGTAVLVMVLSFSVELGSAGEKENPVLELPFGTAPIAVGALLLDEPGCMVLVGGNVMPP